MANTNIVIDSVYKPKTYQEMMAPILEYQKAYDLQQQQNQALLDSANAYYDIVNSENSPEAKSLYDRYTKDLEQVRDDIMNLGITGKTKAAAFNMRDRFQKEITPIENAWKAYQEQIKLADERAKDSTMIQNDPRAVGLDGFLHNINRNFNYVSGNDLRKESATLMGQLSKKLLGDRKFSKILNNQYHEIAQRNGVDPNDINAMAQLIMTNPDKAMAMLASDKEGQNYLATMFQQLMATKDFNWMNDRQRRQALNYIGQGAWAALGEDHFKELENTWNKAAATSHYNKPAPGPTDLVAQFMLDPQNIYSALPQGTILNNDVLKQYRTDPRFTKMLEVSDGIIRIKKDQIDNLKEFLKKEKKCTQEELDQYNRYLSNLPKPTQYPSSAGVILSSVTQEQMDAVADVIWGKGKGADKVEEIQSKLFANQLQDYFDYYGGVDNYEANLNNANYIPKDGMQYTYYNIPISTSQEKDALKWVQGQMNNGVMYEARINNQTGEIEADKTRSTFKPKDLNSDNVQVIGFKIGTHNNPLVVLRDNNGEMHYLILPETSEATKNTIANMSVARQIEDAYLQGKYLSIDNSRQVSLRNFSSDATEAEKEKAAMEEMYRTQIVKGHRHFMNNLSGWNYKDYNIEPLLSYTPYARMVATK